jgi:Leucine-rich repeat (LRR) protein
MPGVNIMSLDQLLSPSSPSFPSLKSLKLSRLRIQQFPASIAGELLHLKSLDLSDNSLTQLPNALSQITTLRDLKINSNKALQLRHSNVDTLAALPQLQSLHFDKSGVEGWSQESVETFIAIKLAMPNLHMGSFLQAFTLQA